MNSKKFIAKQFIFTIFSLTFFIMSAFGLVNMAKAPEVYASGSNMTEVSITNSNFNTSTSSTYPFSPSGYTLYMGDSTISSSNLHSSIKSGVINIKTGDYSTTFEGATRASSYDAYVLMIDSQTIDTNLGYRSSSFNVEADSSYLITVDVYTNTASKIVDLFLYSNDEQYAKIENVSSKYGWTTCSFLISTSDESSTLTLGMYLNGKGVALFDNISAFKFGNNDIASTYNQLDASISTYVNNSVASDVKYISTINGFVNQSLSTDKTTLTNSDFNGTAETKEVADTDSSTGYAYQISATESIYSLFSTKDDFITAKQNLTYRVRVKAKTKNLTGSAYIALVPTNYDKDSISSTISSNSTFTNYDFFIKGNPTSDVNFKLTFALGSTSANASGSLLIESIEIAKVTYSTYSNGSNQIDLTVHDYSDDIMLTNGDFSDVKIGDVNNSYPATATSWNVTTGTGTQYYGIVNTETSNFSLTSANIFNLQNPSADQNNNVLLMYNADADTLIYKSETKSLDANSYHRFGLDVITYDAPLKISLVTTKEDEEVVLSTLTVDDNLIDWQHVELLISTSDRAIDVALKLELTTTKMGYAYVDDAKYDFPGINSSIFNKAVDSDSLLTVDLDDVLATSAKSNLFTDASNSVTTQIVDADTNSISGINVNVNYADEFKKITNKKVYAIRALADTYFTAESKIGFDLTSGNAYKISVSVYTQNLSANDSETDLEKIGAGFGLTGFEDETFSSIQSNNEWTTYTFYVQPDDDVTTYLTFSLGTSSIPCKGDAFFGDITILTEDDDSELPTTISSLESSNNDEHIKVMKLTTDDTDETEDTDTDTEDNSDDSSSSTTSMWFYYIPSIIFAISIVICVVGIMMRKIRWKKPHKKSKNEYDRSRSASKQLYMRQATTLRETKLRELNKELATAHENRASYENNYKQSLTKMRELKIKRASEEEIKALDKQMKKNQKLSSSIGLTISKLEREIAYVKTDEYLNSLTRKLSYQKQDDEVQE